ncbi:general stress protein [Plantactinospora sp. KBS50]|uniref:general stress protein n=1 Tax=Plantactinospora sp. KBS50 TaxID=2024580 RepID=UPI000BAB1929|nr:general stress protein [Plantactinospora sp. KBS50]ASW57199.1 glycine zipper family protein [Plantactinospora sp. KBS50]
MMPTLGATTATTAATPTQRAVALYPTYTAAEQAVDYLSDRHFPVEHVAIVGRGLHSYEQVTGRLTHTTAAAYQALGGAVLGALFGWILGLFNLVNPLVSALLLAVYGAIIGAVLGGLLGLVAHAITGGRRDFASIRGLRADSYELLVDDAHAERAAGLLAAPDAPARD